MPRTCPSRCCSPDSRQYLHQAVPAVLQSHQLFLRLLQQLLAQLLLIQMRQLGPHQLQQLRLELLLLGLRQAGKGQAQRGQRGGQQLVAGGVGGCGG